MSELDELARQLQRNFANRPGSADWQDPLAMQAALGRIRQAFADRLAERAGPRTNRALLAFRMAPQTAPFVDLKLACRAIARAADWEGRRLIDDDRLFTQLLARVDALQGHQHQSCLRALQAALAELQNAALSANERRLQDWLAIR